MPVKRRIVDAFRYALGFLVLWLLFSQVDWRQAFDIVEKLSPKIVAAILLLSVVGQLFRFGMWYFLFNTVQPTRFKSAVKMDLVIVFVNHLVPSQVGGRSVAPALARRYAGLSWDSAVAVVGVHTSLFAIFYGVTATVGWAFLVDHLSRAVLLLILGSIILYLGMGGTLLLAGWDTLGIHRLVDRLSEMIRGFPGPSKRVSEAVGSFAEFTERLTITFREISANPMGVGLYSVCWMVSLLFVPGARVGLLLSGVDWPFAISVLPFLLVAAYSVTLFPLTPGGIGVAEVTATLVFISLGLPGEVIAPVILLDRFFGNYLPALLGWYPAVQIDIWRRHA